jgi:hypothetical protein
MSSIYPNVSTCKTCRKFGAVTVVEQVVVCWGFVRLSLATILGRERGCGVQASPTGQGGASCTQTSASLTLISLSSSLHIFD